MNETLKTWIGNRPDGGRVFEQERLIAATAENIWALMEQQQKSKVDLANALDRSRAYITQMLSGSRNMTLRTLSDIAFALGARVEIRLSSKNAAANWSVYTNRRAAATYSESVGQDLEIPDLVAVNWQIGVTSGDKSINAEAA